MAETPAKHEPRLPPTGELTAKYQPVPLVAHSDSTIASEQVTGSYPLPPSPGAGPPAIPGYDIVGELGRGGMGIVYKVYQVRAKRFAALKMVIPGLEADPTLLQRFHSEAQAVAHLAHPNIVQIYEMGDYNGWPFFSLEFCGGGSLARKLGGTPMLPHHAAELMEKVARAVAYAHQRQIVHRDLKPGNILLTPEGEPKIGDFGLAKRLDGRPGTTRIGTIIGTPSYLAPELVDGKSKSVSPACDIYAVGAVLYECLTGRPPFKGANVIDTLEQIRRQRPIPPRAFNLKISPDLDAVCMKCLRRNPSDRYATAQEAAEDLHRYLKGMPTDARPESTLVQVVRVLQRPRAMVAAAVLLAVFALSIAGSLMWLLSGK